MIHISSTTKNGNCLSETVPQVAGKTVARTFDSLNRRTSLALGTDLSAAYAYDAFGRISSIASGVDTVAFDYRTHGTALAGKRWLRNDVAVAAAAAEYDAWGNIAEIEFGAPGNLHSLGYIYDVADRRTQASLPDGTKWLYGYDRLSQVTSGERVDATTNAPVSGGSFRYAYDGIGNRTTSQEGSSANLLQYSTNNLNQYVSIFSPGVIPIRGRADADAKVAVTTTVGGTSTTYVPDRDGQDFSIDIPVDNSSGAVTAAVQVDALKYDGTLDLDLHRRLSGDYTVSAATPEVPTYDLDGNLLSYDGWTYTWNGEDRLVSATRGTTRLEFAYDYMGRRFEKKVYENNVLTKHSLFIYDGFKQIAEYDALNSNALANTYLWQPVGLDVPLLRNNDEFFVSDANKNIVALIDTTGQVTDTYVYAPFGNCTHAGTSTNPFQFSSEYFDAETGLVYYNYRYYSPKLGRWLRRDPIKGHNETYTLFVKNTPLNQVDYLGLLSIGDIIALIPGIGTIYNLIVDPQGSNVSDYTINISRKSCCELGSDAAELQCIKSIVSQVSVFEAKYIYFMYSHDLVDAVVGLLVSNPIAYVIVGVDSLIDTLISLNKIEKIGEAGNEAKKKCDCSLY